MWNFGKLQEKGVWQLSINGHDNYFDREFRRRIILSQLKEECYKYKIEWIK